MLSLYPRYEPANPQTMLAKKLNGTAYLLNAKRNELILEVIVFQISLNSISGGIKLIKNTAKVTTAANNTPKTINLIIGNVLTSLKYCKYKTDNKEPINTIIPHKIIEGIKNHMTDANVNGEIGHLTTVYKIIASPAGIYIPSMFFNSLRNSIVTFDKNKLAPEDGKVIKTLLSSAT